MEDGRIAYVDFGNVAQLSQYNKQILVDAVVHAVNEDYVEMANDFIKLGFLSKGRIFAGLDLPIKVQQVLRTWLL